MGLRGRTESQSTQRECRRCRRLQQHNFNTFFFVQRGSKVMETQRMGRCTQRVLSATCVSAKPHNPVGWGNSTCRCEALRRPHVSRD